MRSGIGGWGCSTALPQLRWDWLLRWGLGYWVGHLFIVGAALFQRCKDLRIVDDGHELAIRNALSSCCVDIDTFLGGEISVMRVGPALYPWLNFDDARGRRRSVRLMALDPRDVGGFRRSVAGED